MSFGVFEALQGLQGGTPILGNPMVNWGLVCCTKESAPLGDDPLTP